MIPIFTLGYRWEPMVCCAYRFVHYYIKKREWCADTNWYWASYFVCFSSGCVGKYTASLDHQFQKEMSSGSHAEK
jgi:hypothetical protein